MAETREVIRVFLASPGDLIAERKIAREVVEEINELLAHVFGYHVELVGWEDTVSRFGRPQELINRDLDRCELFIGLMWRKWGTPPDTAGGYSSGFEEEFRRSLKRRRRHGQPEISLYFKDVDSELLKDPGEDLKKVLAFKAGLIADKSVLFENFLNARDFESKLRRCIARYIADVKNRNAGATAEKTQSRATQNASTLEADADQEPAFSIEGVGFLTGLIAKAGRDRKNITTVDVARFRLLGSIIGQSGNDEKALGTHDANALFAARHKVDFGHSELVGLFACGLQHYQHANVPIWHWYASIQGFSEQALPLYTFIGSTDRKVGALVAMKTISQRLEAFADLDREIFINTWLADDAPEAVKAAALSYLGELGKTEDLPAIRKEFDRNHSQTTNGAVEAIVRINLRDSTEKAIIALFDLQPSTVDTKLLSVVFASAGSLSKDLLLAGLSHKNDGVRREIAQLLLRRDEITVDVAERLSADTNVDVRLVALSALATAGRPVSEAEARNVLLKPTTSFGLFGSYDSAGDTAFKDFRKNRLRSLPDRELQNEAGSESFYEREAYFTLIERHFSTRGDELRTAVDDQFKLEFATYVQHLTQRHNDQDLLARVRGIEESTRRELTAKAVDILCRKGNAGDLRRIRKVLAGGFIPYSADVVEYVRKFGEWSDIPLLIESLERPRGTGLLWWWGNSLKFRQVANAAYYIGRDRLSELFSLPAPPPFLCQLIYAIADADLRALTDAQLIALLLNGTDTFRKAAVLKCVKALPKKRIAKLLAAYSSRSSYYYNVVHWLDLGASAPRRTSAQSAEKALSRDASE